MLDRYIQIKDLIMSVDKKTKKVHLEIITPCFNEGKNVDIFISKFKNILELKNINDYSITIVDDGSIDETRNFYEKYFQYNNIRIIELSRNYGHQTAILAGLQHAVGEYIIVIDIDLQDPPEVAIDLYEKCISEKLDLVKGIRKKRRGETKFKLLTAFLFYKIISWISDDKSITSQSSGDFYCMSNRFKEALLLNLPPRLYLRGQISQLGFDQGTLLYERESRKYGNTKFSLLKMFSFAYSGILATTNKPLRISGIIGIAGLLVSAIMVTFLTLYRILYGTITPGWTFIVTSIYLCTSIILICLSVISEYLAVLIDDSKTKKRFFVRSIK